MEKIVNYKYRIYPNATQRLHIHQSIGTARWYWNQLLAIQIEQYKKDQTFIFGYSMNQYIKELKEEYPWLSEVSSLIANQQRDNLTKALKAKFKSKKGFPKFKKRKDEVGSYSVQQMKNIIRISDDGKKLHFHKLDWININLHRPLPDKPRTCTVIREGHRYYVCICVKVDIPEPIEEVSNVVGIDLGLKSFVTTSDGQIFDSVKPFRKKKRRFSIRQRRVSRKYSKQGKSNNYHKAQRKVRETHRKIRNIRSDFHWKTAHRIIKDNDLICLEDLNVKGMVKTKLSRSIADAGWSDFVQKLRWVCEKQGKYVIQINRFAPSTKTCNRCGKKKDIPLSERTYRCICGHVMDRDLNAAMNIRDFGIEQYRRADGNLRPTGSFERHDYVRPRVSLAPLAQDKAGDDQVGKYAKLAYG